MRSRSVKILMTLTVLSIFICSCSSQISSGKSVQAAKAGSNTSANTVQNTTLVATDNTTKQSQKEFLNERITQPSPKESSGVEYKGYILDSYDLLYGSLGVPSLERVCKSLDIKMTPVYDKAEQENMDTGNGCFPPYMIYVERGGVKLTFKTIGSRDDYYKNISFPGVLYKVYKDGKEVSFKSVNCYKGTIYLSSLEELMSALEIKRFTDNLKGITYVDSDSPVDIEGRILARNEAELAPGQKSTIQLVYNYDPARIPNYRNIELEILGPENCCEKVFSVYVYGRSVYYQHGTAWVYNIGGDTLIQVSLSETPMDGNVDTVIYKYSDGQLTPVFPTADYEQYLDGKLTLESDDTGNCTFHDKVNGISQPVDLKSEKPNTIFNVDIRDERLEMDPSTGKNELVVRGSAVYKTYFFHLTMIYDKGRFKPEKALLTKSYFSFDLSNPVFFGYAIQDKSTAVADKSEEITQEKEIEVIDELKKIVIENINDPENAKTTLQLPADWHAKEYIRDITSGFEFQSDKNKQIKKSYEFEIYKNNISDDDYNFYTKGLVGRFNMLGYYRDQPERARFPNHCVVKSKVFSGKTNLSQGEIFILDCDLPKDERTKKRSTYEEVYAWIPIDNEPLAYNLSLDVPLDENSSKYVGIIEKMLKVKY